MTTAALYLRQTEKGVPIERQRAECVLALLRNGWEQSDEFVDRESHTGRPGPEWERFLAALRSRRVSHVIAYSAERMFRTLAAVQKFLDLAVACGTTCLLAKDDIRILGAEAPLLCDAARFVIGIEKVRQSEATMAWQQWQREHGRRVGRTPRPNEMEWRLIEELLETGMSRSAIANRLGIPHYRVRRIISALEANQQGVA